MTTRNEIERERIRSKRQNPVYLANERRRQKSRMRKRRKSLEYRELERKMGWWK